MAAWPSGPLLGEVVQRAAGFGLAFVVGGLSLAVSSVLALNLPSDRPAERRLVGVAAQGAGDPPPSKPGLIHRAAVGPRA